MTVSTRLVQLFLRQQQDTAFVPLDNGLRLQVLPDISYLPGCQKHHFAAFIQDSDMLVVWDDEPTHIITRIKDIEENLMSMIWNSTGEGSGRKSPVPVSKLPKPRTNVDVREVTDSSDEFDEKMVEPPRKIVFVQSVLTALTLILVIAAIGNGVRRMLIEVKIDNNYLRLALLVVAPLQIWLALVCCPVLSISTALG